MSLLQASSLNYVGLRKLQIRAQEKLGADLAAKAALPSREELRQRPFFLQSSDSAPPSTQAFFDAIHVSALRCIAKRLTHVDMGAHLRPTFSVYTLLSRDAAGRKRHGACRR